MYRLFISTVALALVLAPAAFADEPTSTTTTLPPQSKNEAKKSEKASENAATMTEGQEILHEEERLPIFSESGYMKALCRSHPKDPRCAELNAKAKKKKRKLADICEADPLHQRCIERRDKLMDDVLEIERFCTVTPDKKRCERLRKNRRATQKYTY